MHANYEKTPSQVYSRGFYKFLMTTHFLNTNGNLPFISFKQKQLFKDVNSTCIF